MNILKKKGQVGRKNMTKFLDLFSQKKIISVDTMIFIYLFEENRNYFALTKSFFKLVESGKIKAITSVISLLETLSAKPLELQPGKRDTYEKFFRKTKNLSTKEVSFEICEKASELRRKFHLLTPDAIQIATACMNKTDIFLTNDLQLKTFKEIQVVCLKDFT